MTVYIHPKDSGPIDTTTAHECSCCGRRVRRKADRIYRDVKPGARRTRPWHTTFVGVCPYCRGSVDSPTAETVRHRDCDTAFELFRAINGNRPDRDTLCPSCKEPLSEETIVRLSE